MTQTTLEARIDWLLSQYRGLDASPSQREIEDLYTDACGIFLSLQSERLRLSRRLNGARLDSAMEPPAAGDADKLARRQEQLTEELAEVTRVVRHLRTAVEWVAAGSAVGEGPQAPPT